MNSRIFKKAQLDTCRCILYKQNILADRTDQHIKIHFVFGLIWTSLIQFYGLIELPSKDMKYQLVLLTKPSYVSSHKYFYDNLSFLHPIVKFLEESRIDGSIADYSTRFK